MRHEEIWKAAQDAGKAKDFFKAKLAHTIGPDRLKHLIDKQLDEFNLIDVRKYEDYIKGHIPYAVHIPYDQMEDQLVKLSKDKVNILYGGFKGWKKRDFDIVENDESDYPG